MLSSEEINCLGDILNTTWGKASTSRGNFPIGTAPLTSLKPSLIVRNDENEDSSEDKNRKLQILFKYTDMVQFSNNRSLARQKNSCNVRARKIIEKAVSELKRQFREEIGKRLKLKELDGVGTVEVLTNNAPAMSFRTDSQKRDAFKAWYRYQLVFEVNE